MLEFQKYCDILMYNLFVKIFTNFPQSSAIFKIFLFMNVQKKRLINNSANVCIMIFLKKISPLYFYAN